MGLTIFFIVLINEFNDNAKNCVNQLYIDFFPIIFFRSYYDKLLFYAKKARFLS